MFKEKPLRRNILTLKVGQYLSLLLCLMLMAVVPIWRDHKIFGIDLGRDKDVEQTLTERPDGTVVINTTEIGKKIMGYGGQTPLEITVKNGVIEKIKPLENQETPEFFGAVRNSDILDVYEGKTLEEASQIRVNGVSGATYSSNAVIENIKKGIAYGLDNETNVATTSDEKLPLKFYITIVIILAGAIIPLYLKDKRYRTLQLILNVLLLGFWGGTFISYAGMISYMTNGITKVVLIPAALMLVTAFIYPMFGKTNHYCLWLCPYGSFQELLGKCFKFKIKISARTVKILTMCRELLWFLLMWLLWTGLWIDWMGYEPFAAFFFTDASAVTLGIAGAFLLLSFVMQRPFCRFVCPTGSLFKFSEGTR